MPKPPEISFAEAMSRLRLPADFPVETETMVMTREQLLAAVESHAYWIGPLISGAPLH